MTRRTRSFLFSATIYIGLPLLLALFIVATSRLQSQVTSYADKASATYEDSQHQNAFYQQTAATSSEANQH